MGEFEPRLAFEHLDKLAYEIGPRLAGSGGDLSAADHIRNHFESCGLEVEKQEFKFVDRSARTKTAACIFSMALTSSLFLPPEFSMGTWLVALGTWRSLRVLMRKRASQNIIAALRVKEPKHRVAITAHLDTAPCVGYRLHLFLRLAFQPILALITLALFLRTLFDPQGWPIAWGVLASIFLPVCGGSFIAASSRRVSPGAHDNASGVAVMLEAARVFSEAPPPGVELTFIALGAEEQGLIGAQKLVEVKLLAKETMVLNLDGVGAGPRAFVIEGNGIFRRRKTSEELNEILADSIKKIGLRPGIRWAALAGYDHIPFLRAGMLSTTLAMEAGGEDRIGRLISKVFLLPNAKSVRGYRYAHTMEDTPERIEITNIERAGRIVLEFVKQVCERQDVEH